MKIPASFFKLVGLVCILPVAIYMFALARTVALYRECREIEKSVSIVADSASGIPEVDCLCRQPCLSNGALVRSISGMCSENGVVIGNYVPKEEDSEGDMRLFSARLELAGGFVPLLKVIECIEEHPGGVRIVSASFRRLRDGKAGYTVTLDLWLMQLEERI